MNRATETGAEPVPVTPVFCCHGLVGWKTGTGRCPRCQETLNTGVHPATKDLRETIMKLGMLTGGNYGHPDQDGSHRFATRARIGFFVDVAGRSCANDRRGRRSHRSAELGMLISTQSRTSMLPTSMSFEDEEGLKCLSCSRAKPQQLEDTLPFFIDFLKFCRSAA